MLLNFVKILFVYLFKNCQNQLEMLQNKIHWNNFYSTWIVTKKYNHIYYLSSKKT